MLELFLTTFLYATNYKMTADFGCLFFIYGGECMKSATIEKLIESINSYDSTMIPTVLFSQWSNT